MRAVSTSVRVACAIHSPALIQCMMQYATPQFGIACLPVPHSSAAFLPSFQTSAALSRPSNIHTSLPLCELRSWGNVGPQHLTARQRLLSCICRQMPKQEPHRQLAVGRAFGVCDAGTYTQYCIAKLRLLSLPEPDRLLVTKLERHARNRFAWQAKRLMSGDDPAMSSHSKRMTLGGTICLHVAASEALNSDATFIAAKTRSL